MKPPLLSDIDTSKKPAGSPEGVKEAIQKEGREARNLVSWYCAALSFPFREFNNGECINYVIHTSVVYIC
jgi:hypothetical protein